MNEKRPIKILQPDGKVIHAEIRVERTAPALLAFSDQNAAELMFEGRDVFEALRALRIHLEQRGCRALCAGARIDVFPSGMSRDMSGGRKAYITQFGVPAKESVDVLDEAAPELIGTVSQQTEYHNKWIRSLKR